MLLDKSGMEVEVEGRFEAKKDEIIKVKVVIKHLAAHTRAKTQLRGVAHDKSLIKFEGRIEIAPNCPDTQSFLTERVLLVGELARAETIPDLEIESSDVQCSHAASISHLDEEQIFYLMSRGIRRKKAEKMLIKGFLSMIK